MGLRDWRWKQGAQRSCVAPREVQALVDRETHGSGGRTAACN
jgi:hypothetical protein